MDIAVVKQSGLRQKGELDKLFGVSRVTVNGYMTGKAVPARANKKRITTVVATLAALVKQGKLPFDKSKTSADRAKAVEKIQAFIQTAAIQ